MSKERVLGFSDGVIAVIITIMVLELKVPEGDGIAALRPLVPIMLAYVLSFIFVGIYWNNHHHMFYTVKHIDGRIMWANLHFLFWLSLVPFVTAWMGQNHFAAVPLALYGFVLLSNGIAYTILQTAIVAGHGPDSTLALAIGHDLKGKISVVSYVAAIGLAFVNPWIAGALYVAVAILWLVPDRRIEKTMAK